MIDAEQLADAFAPDYGHARGKFLAAAEAAGAELSALLHPERGRGGEELALDLAWVGSRSSSHVLVVASGTHGGEGFMGSGLQVQLLRDLAGDAGGAVEAELQREFSILFVHAHNPHGFSWVRRVNEDNIDLNRNFVDFGSRVPANATYADLHDWLVPEDWGGPSFEAAERAIAEWVAQRGEGAFYAAVGGGQYTHADGLFYGGTAPSWTRRSVAQLCARHLTGTARVSLLDLHTGLGPRAYGELIYAGAPESAEHQRLRGILGDDVTCPAAGTSSSPPVSGTIDHGYREVVGAERFTGVVLEVGTLPLVEVLAAHRRDAVLWKYGDPRSAEGDATRSGMRAAMFGEEPEWQVPVQRRFQELVERFARSR